MNLIVLTLSWLLMMVFSHDHVVNTLNANNEQKIQHIQSGTDHFETGVLALDDVVKSFQHHWQVGTTGLSAQSEQPEVSFELSGFVIAPRIHQIVDLDVSFENLSTKGVFKFEFSNQREQLYYDSTEISLAQLSTSVNLNDLVWTENNLKAPANLRTVIDWSKIGQLDAWVIRFYPVGFTEVHLRTAAIKQFEPREIDANQLVNCNHSLFKFPACWVNNRMQSLEQHDAYQLGFSLMTYNSFISVAPWVLAMISWGLVLWLLFRMSANVMGIHLMVSAVFFATLLAHQKWVVDYFTLFSGLLILPMLALVWVKRQVFLLPKNNAFPVWLVSGLVAMLMLGLGQFELNFLDALPLYFLWACVQQLLIGPVFSSSLKQHLKTSDCSAACVVGVLFSIIHAPNHVLMLATLVGGVAWSYLWLKYENIYANAFSHALLALVFYQVMPDAWLGSARIGVFF